MYICIYICIYVYVYIYIYVCMYVCIGTSSRAHTFATPNFWGDKMMHFVNNDLAQRRTFRDHIRSTYFHT